MPYYYLLVLNLFLNSILISASDSFQAPGCSKVTKCLGRGSFADVYKATHLEHGEIALKSINCYDEISLQECENERQLLRFCKHPNIIKMKYALFSEAIWNKMIETRLVNDLQKETQSFQKIESAKEKYQKTGHWPLARMFSQGYSRSCKRGNTSTSG